MSLRDLIAPPPKKPDPAVAKARAEFDDRDRRALANLDEFLTMGPSDRARLKKADAALYSRLMHHRGKRIEALTEQLAKAKTHADHKRIAEARDRIIHFNQPGTPGHVSGE